MQFKLSSIDKFGIKRDIPDAIGAKISFNRNGDYMAKWYCLRPIQYRYDEFISNNIIIATDKWLNTIWIGRLNKPTISRVKKNGRDKAYNLITCECTGLFSTLSDTHFRGSLTTGTPENMITQLMTSSLMRYIDVSVTNQLVATGHTNKKYQTPDSGAKALTIQKIVQDLCDIGMSDNRIVIPYITTNRILRTRALPLVPTIRYSIPETYVDKTEVSRDLLSADTVVVVLYKDAGGVNQTTGALFNNAVCNNLGANFGSSLIPYTRERIVDITGLGNTDLTQAQAIGNSILQSSQVIKVESKSINVSADAPVIDNINGFRSEISIVNIRPNEYTRIVNLTLGLNSTNLGTGLADSINNDTFLISEVEIDNDTGSVKITPEVTNRFNTLLA